MKAQPNAAHHTILDATLDRSIDRRSIDRLLELTTDLVVRIGADGRFMILNDAWRRRLGHAVNQSLRLVWLDFVHVDDRPAMRAALEVARISTDPFNFHLRLRRSGGSHALFACRAVMDGPDDVLMTARDVRAEDALRVELRDASIRYADVAALSRIFPWDLSLSGQKATWLNEARAPHRVGPKFQLRFEDICKFFGPGEQDALRRAIKNCANFGLPWNMDVLLTTADSELLWVRSASMANRSRDGRIVRIVGSFQDVTARRTYDAQLEDARLKARSIGHRLCGVIESLDDVFVLYDENDRLIFCNRKLREIASASEVFLKEGSSFGELTCNGITREKFPDAYVCEKGWLKECIELHRNSGALSKMSISGGRYLCVHEKRAANSGIVGDRCDIAAMKHQEQALMRSKEAYRQAMAEVELRRSEKEALSRRLKLALDVSKIGVWEADISANLLIFDPRMCEICGLPPNRSEYTYDDWKKLLHSDEERSLLKEHLELPENESIYKNELRIIRPDGEIRYLRERAVIMRNDEGQARMVGVTWDITADVLRGKELEKAKKSAEEAKERQRYTALHDPLTSLPNRRYLEQALKRKWSRSMRHGERCALMHVDLDGFKQINDSYGHAVGDAVLLEVANRLRDFGTAECFAARIGGDEFVVVGSLDQKDDAHGAAETLLRHINGVINIDGAAIQLEASIGVTVSDVGKAKPESLMLDADMALYRAKRDGRARVQMFTEELRIEIEQSKRLSEELLNGLENGEFFAHYQPQFDAETLDVVGVEALARWRHPTRGVLGPGAFMEVATRSDAMGELDRQIMKCAFADARAWAEAGVDVGKIAINVSSDRLSDPSLIAELKGVTRPSCRVAFELLETIDLEQCDDVAIKNIVGLRACGVSLELDDFGAGHASIVSLLNLRPDLLKIDRQLIIPLLGSDARQHMVKAILQIGDALGVGILAEGVETPQHARILRELGCGLLQGFAFTEALPSTKLVEYLQAENWRERFAEEGA